MILANPANKLIGTTSEIFKADANNNGLFRRRNVNLTALSIAANIPSRIVESLSVLS